MLLMEQLSPPADQVAVLVEAASPPVAPMPPLVQRLALVPPVFPRSE